jgi:hypothetical protein
LASRESGPARAIHAVGTDAIFNNVQVPELLADLRAATATAPSDDVAGNLVAAIQFISSRVSQAPMHIVYVAFVSD